MRHNIKYINWKVDTETLKSKIKEVMLQQQDTLVNGPTIEQAKAFAKGKSIGAWSWVICAISNIILCIIAKQFTIFDVALCVICVLSFYTSKRVAKKVLEEAMIRDTILSVTDMVKNSIIEVVSLDELLALNLNGDIGTLIKVMRNIKYDNIESVNIQNNMANFKNRDSEVLSIPMDSIYVRDGVCDAITVNDTGIFIGSQSNVALNGVETKEVNLTVDIEG